MSDDTIPFEIAARAVCAAEVADLSAEKRRKYVEENWRDRLPLMIAADARFHERQAVTRSLSARHAIMRAELKEAKAELKRVTAERDALLNLTPDPPPTMREIISKVARLSERPTLWQRIRAIFR